MKNVLQKFGRTFFCLFLSQSNVTITRAIVQAGKLLDVEVLDHMVIGQGKWVSLKERGLGFA